MGLAAGEEGEEGGEEADGEEGRARKRKRGQKKTQQKSEEWLRRKQSLKESRPSKTHAFSPNRLYCVS